jgi:hypothetical protein
MTHVGQRRPGRGGAGRHGTAVAMFSLIEAQHIVEALFAVDSNVRYSREPEKASCRRR